MSETPPDITQAIALHRAGRLDEAQALYRAIAGGGGAQAGDALHLLGVLLRQTGDPVGALEALGRALRLGTPAGIETSVGNAVADAVGLGARAMEAGDALTAIAAFQAVLAVRPDTGAVQRNLLTLFNLAVENARLPRVYELFGLLTPLPPQPAAGGRVIDTFQFCDELDVLEIRLNELSGVVDRFVLVEADRTHLGQPKPLVFAGNRGRFAAFAERIEHVVVTALPDDPSPWVRENAQREAIARGLVGLRPNDVVVVSDVDEIPRAEALARARDHLLADDGSHGCLCVFAMPDHYFRLDYRNDGAPAARSVAVRGDRFHRVTPQILRHLRLYADLDGSVSRYPHPFHVLPDAGWHFSFVGDDEAVAGMFARMLPHAGVDPPRFRADEIAGIIRERRRIFRPNERWTVAPPEDLPACIRRHPERFAGLMAGGGAA